MRSSDGVFALSVGEGAYTHNVCSQYNMHMYTLHVRIVQIRKPTPRERGCFESQWAVGQLTAGSDCSDVTCFLGLQIAS